MAVIWTLSFIPTLGTMLLGVIAGRWYREAAPQIPLRRFVLSAFALCAIGLALHFTGICPIVKRVWTPAWTLFSGGVCFLFCAAFSWLVDVKKKRGWVFPLIVVGMNSIAAYTLSPISARTSSRVASAFTFGMRYALNFFRIGRGANGSSVPWRSWSIG